MALKLDCRKGEAVGYKKGNFPGVSLWWLGQAGFLIRFKGRNILVDPYLSDFLAAKYKGKAFPHIRMMKAPIAMEELTHVDYCFCSHAHSDHMDPGLIPILREVSPRCRFVCPEAVRGVALDRGAPEDRLIGLDGGSSLSLGEGLEAAAVPAAHEELRTDERGRHLFLGFIFRLGDYRIFHPGDCLPYEGLDRWLRPHAIDLALMPVNGRREELSAQGIAGNFNMDQACQIMADHGITYMIPQHYGMFDFNTVSPESIRRTAEASGMGERIFPAAVGWEYRLSRA